MPMAISTRPKTATHMVASCERKLAIWLIVEPINHGPAAIGLMTSGDKGRLEEIGLEFQESVEDPQHAEGALQGPLIEVK